jgi:hypothetical protein
MMSKPKKKQFFAKHSKSSAALVSLGIHAILIVVALSFVAVTVIQKEESKFEAKPVSRPKMQLKRLQVPVNIEKKRKQKPKLRKRIVVQPKINQNMPDIKMPELTGVKGGLGSGGIGNGIGGAEALGFTMPEINLFGVKSKGEKVFIILDSTPWIMYDELGGIPAYTIIKEELVKILGTLNPTVLFNVAVYGHGTGSYVLFPQMVSANKANVAKVDSWLQPLNAVEAGGYGTKTLGPGGTKIGGDLVVEPLKNVNHWSEPMMFAMQQQADTVFVLANGWGHLVYEKKAAKAWSESKQAKYNEIKKKAEAKLAEENKQRRAAGKPERVLVGSSLINAYYPGTESPPQPERYWYTPKEMAQAFVNQRKASASGIPVSSGLGQRSKKAQAQFSLNVVQFVPISGAKENDQERFKEVTSLLDGEYRAVPGLEAIKSSISSGEGE